MRTLKINLFYQCTAKCNHCRFNCTNENSPETPDFETPYNTAKKLKTEFGLDTAVVLGGEPSIFATQTHELLAKLSSLGVSTRLETNACWATDAEAADAFLSPLKASNTSLMLSLDAFHEPYVSFENITRAIESCIKFGIKYNLETPYLNVQSKSHPIDKKTQELESKIKSMIKDIKIDSGNVIFTGRAADMYGDEFAIGKSIPSEPCKKVPWWWDGDIETTQLLILEPNGWLTKGCGIAIGNVHKQDIFEIVGSYNAYDNPIFSVLLKEGPLGLAREAQKHGYIMKRDYADSCHLCHESRQVLKSVYPDILQPEQHYPAV